METRTSETSQILVWIAAISLIVFCGAGVAALMGWIPTSLGKPETPVIAKLKPPVAVVSRCTGCGVVKAVRGVTAKRPGASPGSGSGLGAVGGEMVGGVYEITVDLDDGTSRVFTEASAPPWRNGDKVRIVNGVIESNA